MVVTTCIIISVDLSFTNTPEDIDRYLLNNVSRPKYFLLVTILLSICIPEEELDLDKYN